jgi:hypothetical protein
MEDADSAMMFSSIASLSPTPPSFRRSIDETMEGNAAHCPLIVTPDPEQGSGQEEEQELFSEDRISS